MGSKKDQTIAPEERLLPFAFGKSVRDNKVTNKNLTWREFVDLLREPVRGKETQTEYFLMPKEQQDALKDVGYYVPGHFQRGTRRLANIEERHCVTLDWDHAPRKWLELLLGDGLTWLGAYAFVVHSTRKHTTDAPRVRIIIPASRLLLQHECGAFARAVAAAISEGAIEFCDVTTFQFSRPMHLPSVSADVKYEYFVNDGPFIDPDKLLAQYKDSGDMSSWPVSSRERDPLRQHGKKAQDPTTKPGLIGAYCRVYDMVAAMETHLPGVYAAGNGPNRFTFVGGSTSNGAVIYEGMFLYSHHESDPCGGRLVNPFDAVRLHKFSERDAKVAPGTPIAHLPSQRAMLKFAAADPLVAAELLANADELLQAEVSDGLVTRERFWCFLPANKYIFTYDGSLWPGVSVDKRLPPTPANGVDENGDALSTSAWLSYNRRVEQMTWHPGEPSVVTDRLINGSGWVQTQGTFCYNLYKPPTLTPGDAHEACPWLDHLRRVYPEDADHIIQWLAFKVQHPGEKINHVLVLGGAQGIGKDSILAPIAQAIGPWNFADESPTRLLGRFNGFVKSVILRISEARDLGEVDRYSFYEHMKVYAAAPPDVLMCDEKYIREVPVFNVMGVIITTNHLTDGIYLPEDDRRHYVAWSGSRKEDFPPEYWRTLHSWYAAGGYGHVSAYLRAVDLTGFDAKAPPPKTAAFWAIVEVGKPPEDSELADAVEKLGSPPALTLGGLARCAAYDLLKWLSDRDNRRAIPHRLEGAGYTAVRNQHAKDGMFVVAGRRQAIYARSDLPVAERATAATATAVAESVLKDRRDF